MQITNQFKHIIPKEGCENAKKFFEEYGGLFGILGQGIQKNGIPTIVLTTCEEKQLIVEKRDDGIYINKELYCKEW